MHVKPKSGAQVPDPELGGYLPPEGREVEATIYWLRRIKDGDVVEVAQKSVKTKGTEK